MDEIPKGKRLHFRDAFRKYVLDDPELKDLAISACKIDVGSRLVFEQLHYPSETYLANNGYCWPISYNWEDHCQIRDGMSMLVLGSQSSDEPPPPDIVLKAFEKLGELVTAFFAKLANEELVAYGRDPGERNYAPIPWDYWEPDNTNKCVDVTHGEFLCYLERLDSKRPLSRFKGMKVGAGDIMPSPSPDCDDGQDVEVDQRELIHQAISEQKIDNPYVFFAPRSRAKKKFIDSLAEKSGQSRNSLKTVLNEMLRKTEISE